MLATMTLPGTFWFYSSISLIGAIILYFILPETEGRTLMEIEQHFSGGKLLNERNNIINNSQQEGTTRTTAACVDHVQFPTICTAPASNEPVQTIELQHGNTQPFITHQTNFDLNSWESNRIFQKHLDEHRTRLDGHKHDHHPLSSQVLRAKRVPRIYNRPQVVHNEEDERTIYSTHL